MADPAYRFRTESHSENKINPHNSSRTVMKNYGKYQEAFCTKVGSCRSLKAVFGLAILAIVASSAQAQKVTWEPVKHHARLTLSGVRTVRMVSARPHALWVFSQPCFAIPDNIA
jgi:hypothetical protein